MKHFTLFSSASTALIQQVLGGLNLQQEVIQHILSQLPKNEPISADAIWDVYMDISLNSHYQTLNQNTVVI